MKALSDVLLLISVSGNCYRESLIDGLFLWLHPCLMLTEWGKGRNSPRYVSNSKELPFKTSCFAH